MFCFKFLRRKDDKSEMNKTKEDKDSFESNKGIIDRRIVNDVNRDESGKDGKKETSNEIKSQDVKQARTFNSHSLNKNFNCYELSGEGYESNNTVIINVTGHSLKEENRKYTKYIDLTEKAVAEGDLAKAELFISKAIRINPNDNARQLLKRVQGLRVSQLYTDEANDLHHILQSKTTVEVITAEKYIDDAQNAFDEGNYTKTLRLLTKSERIYPAARAKDLRKHAEEKLFANGEDSGVVVIGDIKSFGNKNAGVPKRKRKRTIEKVKEIERVKQAIDDYETLGKFTNRIQVINECRYQL